MTIEILEHVYPRTGSHLLRAVLQIIDTDLGPQERLEFVKMLGTIESALLDTQGKLAKDGVGLLTELDSFEGLVRDYLRMVFGQISAKPKEL